MPSHRPTARTGKSKVRTAERNFRSETERQLLEIHDAFGVFVDDSERQRREAMERQSAAERQRQEVEDRLRDMERRKDHAEDRLRLAESQKQDVERKLQKTFTVRFVRFFKKLNPLRSTRARIP